MDEQTVKARLAELLPTVDLASSTERSIRASLEEHLGDLSAFRILIRDEIENFLVNYEDPNDAGEVVGQAPPAASKRPEPAEPAAPEPAKRAKVESAPPRGTATQTGSLPLKLSEARMVNVENFKGQMLVSMREYYTDATGQQKPGKKGISLNRDQWSKLASGAQAINDAVNAGGVSGYVVDLSPMRKVRVEPYKGRLLIDVREFYSKGGDLLPGPKGIAMSQEQWELVVAHLALISAAMGTGGGSAPGPAAAAAPSTSTSAPAPAPGGGGEGSAAAPAAASGGDAPVGKVSLSSNRFATVERFGGKPMVSVREFYEKQGEMCPGRKGLTMTKEQWKALVEAAPAVDAAIQANANNFRIADLSSRRFLGVEQFKGSPLVSMREYYDKDGDLKPGQKGISLSTAQWAVLSANIRGLDAYLDTLA